MPIFAFLTGFVCAYKPIKLALKNQIPQARRSIARSVFRRPPRLMLPATIATFISFLMCCMDGYWAAARSDNYWVRFDTPHRRPTLWQSAAHMIHSVITTWTNRDNPYDRHQWALRPLLIGAFQVYLVLMGTIGMRFRYRILVHLLLMGYWWQSREPDVGELFCTLKFTFPLLSVLLNMF